MTLKTHEGHEAGWTYSQAGTPVSFIMPPGEPNKAILIPHDTWWQALRFALHFAENNGCKFVGGPDNGL